MLEASSLGRVRACVKIKNSKYESGHILSQIEKFGYLTIRIAINKKRKQFSVHRLVCDAFHGQSTLLACHKDGNKKNNIPENLYWATQMQNILDREKHGTTMRGDTHYARKLKSEDIPAIRRMLKDGLKQTEIAKIYGVTNYAIHDIKRKKSWKNY